MEGADPGEGGVGDASAGHEGGGALAHFVGGFVCEGDGEDLGGGDGALGGEIGDAVREDAGFAAASAS